MSASTPSPQDPASGAQASGAAPSASTPPSTSGTSSGHPGVSTGDTAQQVTAVYRGPADTCVLQDGTNAPRNVLIRIERAILHAAWNAGHHLDEVTGH